MYEEFKLNIPDTDLSIQQGDKVKLGRFDEATWVVLFGWYSWGGNRPVCGWYLTRDKNPDIVKPLQLTDLDDIYLVERSQRIV